jgi:hypothetical protein
MKERTLTKAEKLRAFNEAYEKEKDIFKKMELKDQIDEINGVKHAVCDMLDPENCETCSG